MLYQAKETTAETFGKVHKTTVTMAMNRKSFDVVIDQLYSDTMRAAIREVMANAWDSHIAAGKPETPFTIMLPNTFDSTFTVRDYGTSMTEKVIDEVYSVMFASTKDKSNDETGTFGLGSKSPFSYTDVYTLTCFLDGECRVYSCYLDDDGIPAVDLVSRGATDEEDGCAVSFPVKPEDIPAFRDRVLDCGKGYDVLPVTQEDDFWDSLAEPPVMSGDGWKIIKGPHAAISARPYVRQGCVVYPIDTMHLLGDEEGMSLLRTNLVLDMPLGSVAITPSREGLKYTDETIANIKSRLKEVASDIREQVAKLFDKCETYAEAVDVYNELRKGGGLTDRFQISKKWRGRKIKQRVSTDDRGRRVMRDIRVMWVSRHDFFHGRTHRSNGFSGRFENNHALVDPNKITVFVEDTTGDRVTHSGLRVKERFTSIAGLDKDVTGFIWVKGDPNSRDFKRLLVNLGRPTISIVKVNDLPKPVFTPRAASGARRTVKCKVFERVSGRWHEADIDDDADNVLYISKVRNDYPDFGVGISGLKIWLEVLEERGFIKSGVQIVQIPATHKRLIEKNKDIWQNLREVIDACLDTVQVDGIALNYKISDLGVSVVHRKTCQLARKLATHNAIPKERTPFRELVVRYRTLIRNRDRMVGDEKLVKMFRDFRSNDYNSVVLNASTTDTDVLPQSKADELARDFDRRYPIAQYALPSFGTVDTALMDHLLSYINLVDAA